LLIVVWYRKRTLTRADVLAVLPYAVLAFAACCTTIWFQNTKEIAQSHATPDPFIWRVASSGMAVWFYLGKLFAPVSLAMIYPRWQIDVANPLNFVPTLLVVGILVVLYRQRRGWAGALWAGACYYVATLLPVLGFLNMAFFKSSMVSDHLQYIPMVSVSALVASGLANLNRRGSQTIRPLVIGGTCLLVGVLAFLSVQQTRLYANRETLALDTLRSNPKSFWAHGELANGMLARRDYEGAERELRAVIDLDPKSVAAYNNLGTIYVSEQRYGEAVQMFVSAEALRPESVPIHLNLAELYARLGYPDEAKAEIQRALKYEPQSESALAAMAALAAQAPQRH
jgi:hypothetical protein